MIYFVRHGQCQANLEDVFAGQRNDSPLTELGQQEAEQTAVQIRQQGLHFDRIVSSPMSRTQKTAEIIAAGIGFPTDQITHDSRLIEYDMGQLTGQPHRHLTSAEVVAAAGAEDPLAFRQRVVTALTEHSHQPGQTLLVSHAGVYRMYEICRQHGRPQDFYDISPPPNGQLIELTTDFLEG